MYLTSAEAKAQGLPSVQEQIDRYNRAIEPRSKYENGAWYVLTVNGWRLANRRESERFDVLDRHFGA
jgi:hypothetical protein